MRKMKLSETFHHIVRLNEWKWTFGNEKKVPRRVLKARARACKDYWFVQ